MRGVLVTWHLRIETPNRDGLYAFTAAHGFEACGVAPFARTQQSVRTSDGRRDYSDARGVSKGAKATIRRKRCPLLRCYESGGEARHSLTRPSRPMVASVRPVGLIAIVVPSSTPTSNVARSSPVRASKNCAEP